MKTSWSSCHIVNTILMEGDVSPFVLVDLVKALFPAAIILILTHIARQNLFQACLPITMTQSAQTSLIIE